MAAAEPPGRGGNVDTADLSPHPADEDDAVSDPASGPDLATIALLVFFISLIVIVAVLLLLPILVSR